MEIKESSLGGFDTKFVFLNDLILGIATEIGPRILYFASSKRPKFNLFGLPLDFGIQTSEGFWRIYGGHRLWSSPEASPRTYHIDDKPVRIDVDVDSITVRGNPEGENSIQKEIMVKPFSEKSVQVVHVIKNIGRWPVTLGCWALSVMRQDGFAIVPFQSSKVDDGGLLPDRHLSVWPYTDLSDKRITFTNKYIFVEQNPKIKEPLKIGTMANPMWMAYWVDGMVFVKQFSQEKGVYPDFGCSTEIYTNSDILELETLGPLRIVNPSESICLTETWKILEVGKLTPEPESIEKKLKGLVSR